MTGCGDIDSWQYEACEQDSSLNNKNQQLIVELLGDRKKDLM